MLEKKIISVDPGKFATKAVSGEIGSENAARIDFRTKTFKLGKDMDFDINGKSYKVKFEDELYVLGDQGEEVNYSVDKATINHKIATYTAITQLLGGAKNIDLVLGCPTSIYKNKNLREEYKNYILGDGEVNITINNKDYSFNIESILVVPEGYGIVFLEPELFKNNRVAVVDLGGLNMNFAIYDNMIPEISSMFTSNLGSNELETNLINNLNIKYGTSFTTADIQHIIKQGGVKVKGEIDKDSTNMIDTSLEQYMVKLTQETKKNNVNLELMDVVFVGGTSSSIEGKIKEHLPHSFIPKNSRWANVVGSHKLGVLRHAKEGNR